MHLRVDESWKERNWGLGTSDLIWSCFGVSGKESGTWLLIFHFLGWGAYIALLCLEEKIRLRNLKAQLLVYIRMDAG